MFLRRALPGVIAAAGLVLAGTAIPAHAVEPTHTTVGTQPAALDAGSTPSQDVSVATVDAGLSAGSEGEILNAVESGKDKRAKQLAKAASVSRPDVLVLTGLDVDTDGATLSALRSDYFAEAGAPDYRYVYSPSTNVGVDSGADLDGDGTIGGTGDALGAGDFPGQSSLAVLSVHPIDTAAARTFSNLAWDDVPNNHLSASEVPVEARPDVPLFSTSLWDVPIDVGGSTLHVVATKLSPASGDGADPVRNRDQLQLLRGYVSGASDLTSVEDDQGRSGPLAADAPSVVAGDLGVDVSAGGPAADTVNTLLDAADPADTEADSSTGWLSRLDRLLRNGAAATRTNGDKSAARLDYVIGSGSADALDSSTRDAVTTQGTTHRMVITGLDL
jgi:hypothetical protein